MEDYFSLPEEELRLEVTVATNEVMLKFPTEKMNERNSDIKWSGVSA
jgi:hypothetical protein